MPVHQQKTPAIRQGIVEEARQRSEGMVLMLEEPRLEGQAQGRQVQAGGQKSRFVLEETPAAVFSQGADGKKVLRRASEADQDLLQITPRLRVG